MLAFDSLSLSRCPPKKKEKGLSIILGGLRRSRGVRREKEKRGGEKRGGNRRQVFYLLLRKEACVGS